MKKCFFFFVFTALLTAQRINIPLLVSDGTNETFIYFGVDSTATTGIDPHLGEFDIPPMPPTGIIEARFDLSSFGYEGVTTYKDYRYAPSFPFTGSHIHQLWWQIGYGGSAFYISYSLPQGVCIQFQDVITGQLVNTGILCGEGTLAVTLSFINRLKLTAYYTNAVGGIPGPQFAIVPQPLNFPQNPAGVTDSAAFKIYNTGSVSPLIVNSITSDNPAYTFIPSAFPVSIPPSAYGLFYAVNTSQQMPQWGSFQITHNAPGSPSMLNLYTPGSSPIAGTLQLTPSEVTFLPGPPGTLQTENILGVNTAPDTLYILNITSTNSFFSLSHDSVPFFIPPGGTRNFILSCISSDSMQSGIIKFFHNGTGSPSVLNAIYLPPSAIYIQDTLVFQNTSTAFFYIHNIGTTHAGITGINISNPSYQIITPYTLPLIIPPNANKMITVRLNGPGTQHGYIEFIHTGATSPDSLYLTNAMISPALHSHIIIKSGTQTGELTFGIHPIGSDGIDPLLGEIDIPPPPPPGAFDYRFVLPQGNFSGTLNSFTDYRYGDSSFNGQKEHRLSYMPWTGQGIQIFWDLPEYMSGVLQDIITGELINVPIADTGSLYISDPIAFSKLRMLINYNLTNPVEFSSFTGESSGNAILLKWQTASETNNAGFEIERKDQDDWSVISFVQGSGTSTRTQIYNYKDTDIMAGGSYSYRLKQLDFNGTFSYSNEISITAGIPLEYSLEQNYPNPFNGTTIIEYSLPRAGTVTLSLFNSIGELKKIISAGTRQPGSYRLTLDANDLPSGVYFYRLQASTFADTKKLILMK